MGKATIVSGGASGTYQIKMDFGKAERDKRVAQLSLEKASYIAEITRLSDLLETQEATEDAARVTTEAAIAAYVAAVAALAPALQAIDDAQAALAAAEQASYPSPEDQSSTIATAKALLAGAKAAYTAAEKAIKTTLEAHTKALTALVAQKQATAVLRVELSVPEGAQVALIKEIARLQALLLEETRQAWCADLTETATGEVATIEIPGEDKRVLIAPEAPAPVAADGALSAREMQSPEQLFWNAAVLPGWQKFKPTYRRGTITAINEVADTADVLLETTDKSSAQNLVINQTPTLSGVPVKYMSCNAGAFKVGDRAVIKFMNQNWDEPIIVGFVDNPKPCFYGTNLIFWVAGTSEVDAPLVTAPRGTAPTQYVLFVPGRYYFVSVNTPRCTDLKVIHEIGDVDIQETGTSETGETGNSVQYQLLSFFDGKPVMHRMALATTSSRTYDYDNNTSVSTNSLLWGSNVLTSGSFSSQVVRRIEYFGPRDEDYILVLESGSNTWSNFLMTPRSKWGAVVTVIGNGTTVAGGGGNGLPPSTSVVFVPLSTKPNAAQAGSIPAYEVYAATPVVVPVPAIGYPTGPGLNRHELDFFWRPTYYQSTLVRACCKKVFYSYNETPKVESLRVTRYDLGPHPQTLVSLPQIDSTGTGEPWKHNCFFDDHIVSVQSYPDGSDFKLTLHWLDGRAPVKISNRPGAAGVDGEGFTRLTVPGLPAGARLIGAMRDELACM